MAQDQQRSRNGARPRLVGASNNQGRQLPSAAPISLRPREQDLIRLVVHAASNKEIASVLGLTVSSVETYLSRLYERVGARNRVDLALRAQRERWLEDG